jgi:hemin uptake protein HemP
MWNDMDREIKKDESVTVCLDTLPGSDGVVKEMRKVSSTELFGNNNEILIQHDSEIYRLRRTSKGRLLLTK